MELDKIILGDSEQVLKELPNESVDLVVTSPPYDNIKNYHNSLDFTFDKFKNIVNELYRVLKQGGVVIWVVADQTKDGTESGTSFRQALYFKEAGFNLYDTMIYRKLNYMPLTHRRYEQEFEYMFCFSKGIPKTFNPIKVDSTYAGTKAGGNVYKTDGDELTKIKQHIVNDKKIKGNVFEYHTGSAYTGKYKHPAMFPYDLAKDQILSWSNEEDVVLDPFSGAGTTCVAAKDFDRHFIGIEQNEEYHKISVDRLYEKTMKGQISLI